MGDLEPNLNTIRFIELVQPSTIYAIDIMINFQYPCLWTAEFLIFKLDIFLIYDRCGIKTSSKSQAG